MDEIKRQIKSLEKKVNTLTEKEKTLETKNQSIINTLNYVKQISETILNILRQKTQNNIDKIIKSIDLYKQTKHVHPNWIMCILELLDGRIAVCGGGAISLNQMNYETKEWKVLTQRDKAHEGFISSLCEISRKRIISSSKDTKIKIWDVSSNNDIQLIKTITQHSEKVDKVITLTYNRFASCSFDENNVRIWNSETYEQISVPFNQQAYPNSLLQLKQQNEVLVISSNSSSNPSLLFYQLTQPYTLIGTVGNVCTTYRQGLIELSNGHVAVSHHEPHCIYIIDPQAYTLIDTIVDNEYIPFAGPMFAFGSNSFIYVSYKGGVLCEVSMRNGKYTVSFGTKKSDKDLQGNCVSLINNGKYIISGNKNFSCSIFNYSV